MYSVNEQSRAETNARDPFCIIAALMSIKARKPENNNAAASRAKVPSIGPKLRQARERKNMTVRGLARYVGVSPSLVSQIERGRVMPSVGTLYAIANQLELVVDDLFREAGAPRAERAIPSGDAADPVQRGHNRSTIRLAEGVRWERLT